MSTLELRMLVGKVRRVTVEGRRAISKVLAVIAVVMEFCVCVHVSAVSIRCLPVTFQVSFTRS